MNIPWKQIASELEDAILILDPSLGIQFINQAASRVFGYTEQDVLRKPIDFLLESETMRKHSEYLARHPESVPTETMPPHTGVRVKRKDGELLEANIIVTRLTSESGTHYLATVRPCEEERPNKSNSAEFAQHVLDAIDAHVAIMDSSGTIVAVNSAWRRFAEQNDGRDVTEGANYLLVCDRASADDRAVEEIASGIRKLLQNGGAHFDMSTRAIPGEG
ncbi:MAG TPA: PAS domain S-box protein [Leptospiraceae bacterium]|nr:PAS domain S-box protein [Leptospirales bacterium]HMX57444.1 PAS domain S-box protein [Leptospiraceae bacterium]HMY46396.1 PAS domain S-box protein [Leptospiraceae bacterium]HMZ37674.1 PAS domain S-box protein [Leptospiraceae bacterium]HNE23907.1 PAS domain S-box protein [Leptospiraceae bacterium]